MSVIMITPQNFQNPFVIIILLSSILKFRPYQTSSAYPYQNLASTLQLGLWTPATARSAAFRRPSRRRPNHSRWPQAPQALATDPSHTWRGLGSSWVWKGKKTQIYVCVCACVYIYIYSIIYSFIYMYVYIVNVCMHLSICLSICLSIYLSICLSMYPCINIYIYIYMYVLNMCICIKSPLSRDNMVISKLFPFTWGVYLQHPQER